MNDAVRNLPIERADVLIAAGADPDTVACLRAVFLERTLHRLRGVVATGAVIEKLWLQRKAAGIPGTRDKKNSGTHHRRITGDACPSRL